jgi:hypothetical protein
LPIAPQKAATRRKARPRPFSFTSIRFIPFFLPVALLVCCRVCSEPRLERKARPALAAAGLAVALFFLGDAARMYRGLPQSAEVNDYLLPVKAADFIWDKGLQGNMFNYYSWGGYLLWRLAPKEVFIDGRNGDRDLYESYLLVLKGERRIIHGLPFWKQYFLTREIRYTVTPFFDSLSGRFVGLLDVLLADSSWVPVYASPSAVIFAEDVPENREIIRRNALPKEGFLRLLLDYSSVLIASAPSFAELPVARGEILLRLGDRAGALRSFEEALRIAPLQPVARERVARLRGAP